MINHSTPIIANAAPARVRAYLNPLNLAGRLWSYRDLIRQFTRREIEGRYRDSYLGLLWSFVNPLILLLIYTFVFGIVFKSRWPQAKSAGLGEFAVVIFCGFTAFNVFSESVNRAPMLIVSVPNYVKKVIFPLEILPVSAVGSALFHSLINMIILIVANLLINHTVALTILLLPLVALPLIFLSLGLAWLLASLGVFIRDISHLVTLVVQVLFFMSAIIYPIENIPQPYRTIISLNPIAQIAENYRRVILWGTLPNWGAWAALLIASATVMVLGYAFFMKSKQGFADVI